MSQEDCDTAKRLIAKFLQFTLPGQIELPLDWVNGLEKSEEDIVSGDVTLDDDKCIKDEILEFPSSQEENLEDGELIEDDDDDEDGELVEDEDIMEKENPPSTSNTSNCFPSGNNDCDNGDKQKSFSAKQETKRQKYGHLICKFFREGNCREGDSCFYSHNAADSHRTPQLCKEYITGQCRKSLKCNFWHGEHPCKDFHFGRCNALKCRFSHQPLDEYTKAVFDKALKDEEETAASAAANVIPLPPPFSSSQNIPVHCLPPTFPTFSQSANHVMRANPISLLYNKNTFRKSIAPYNKKSSKSKPISAVPQQKVTVDCLLSDIAFSLPNLPQCC